MESRNVKVIDEHSIDRDANVICGLKLDGLDYVLYSIERDGDNDNLFVSKIIKNMDGTSNMINIDDNIEKNKVNEIVKELVTYSIKNDADKTDGKVTLADGKNVEITDVLFNKEQNINVGKTYITTVKKSVTKVSEDFFKVDEPKKEESSLFETVAPEVAMPAAEPEPEPVVQEEPVPTPEPVVPAEPEVKEEVPAPVEPLPVPEPVLPEPAPVTEPEPVVEEPKVEAPEMVMPEPEPVAPEIPVIPVESAVPTPEPVPEPVAEPEVAAPEVVMPVPEPIPVESAVPPVPVPEPELAPEVAPQAPAQDLYFDGTQETNLNMALGEVSEEKTLQTQEEGVQSLREFGVDEPTAAVASAEPAPVLADQPKVLTKSKGFANNKFFMVVAIVFFVAACVFLGYEVFKYIQLVK